MEPRFENGSELVLSGLNARYNMSNANLIPAQWERFGPHIKGQVSYGVIALIGNGGDFDYLCGVEGSLPDQPDHITIPAHRYAVFTHEGPLSTLRNTFRMIFTDWLPKSGRKISNALRFERYSEDFDQNAGKGTLEIWIPIT